MTADGPATTPVASAAPPARRPRRLRLGARLDLLGAVVPGTSLIAAGRRKTGAVVLVLFLAMIGGLAWLALEGQQTLRALDGERRAPALARRRHRRRGAALGGHGRDRLRAAAARPAVAGQAGRRRPGGGAAGGGHRPAGLVRRQVVGTTREVIADVFDDAQSATVDDKPDPFGGKDRVNVLLLGGDAGKNRTGTRTDTVIVASIDTGTGDTTLISLPRNLENLPFPRTPRWRGCTPTASGPATRTRACSTRSTTPARSSPRRARRAQRQPGADWLKLGVGEALGLHLDYYVLVNLNGFQKLVDALGGITVNVNYYVPIGGDPRRTSCPTATSRPGRTSTSTATTR